MKFIKIMIVSIGIFFIGFQQVALAKKDHVPGKPFAFLRKLIDNINNTESTPGPQGAPGPVGPVGPAGPVGPEGPMGPAGILDKYMEVRQIESDGIKARNVIVYCDDPLNDIALSGDAYTYLTNMPDGFQSSQYNDVLRPVCKDYGPNTSVLQEMTCQSGEFPIGWQFIRHPSNRNPANIVINVMCIYAPDIMVAE